MTAAALDWTTIRRRAVACGSLEWIMTDPMAFGMMSASPLQRAVFRVADGAPILEAEADPDVVAAFAGGYGLPMPELPAVRPDEISIISGVRTGKSTTAAGLACHWSQTCDVSGLRAGEIPRIPILSLDKDKADVVFQHIAGSVMASPFLREILLDEPLSETLLLRHPTGRPVEVMVTAGKKAGGAVVSRWLAGIIFDEFPRMNGALDGVVNYTETRKAAQDRLLPGAQVVNIGSPYAPFGPAFDQVNTHWGKPSQRIVVVRAPAWVMNPVWWTPERVAKSKEKPDVYRTDCAAEFATPEEAMLSVDLLDRATRAEPRVLPAEVGCSYVAAVDPATRGNGWTLSVATRKGRKKIICRAEEWRGSRSEPLNPAVVLKEIAIILRPYFPGRESIPVLSDQYMGDALKELARQAGIALLQVTTTSEERAEAWLAIRTRLEMGEIELPPVPLLRSDLLHLRKRATVSGISVELPDTGDGRHCDHAPTTMLVLKRWLADEKPEEFTRLGQDPETVRMRDAVSRKFERKREDW
jgi:hypothetical protein